MPNLLHPFIFFGLFSAVVSLAVGAIAWRQRNSRGARSYAVLMVLLAVWSLLYVLQLRQPTAAEKQPWFMARHALSPLVGVLFWLFAARYTNRRELLSMRYLGPILGVGAVMAVLPVLNPLELFWADIALYTQGGFARGQTTFGPLFWVFVGYIVVVVGGGHGYIVRDLVESFAVYRRQLAAMGAVGAIEFALLFLFLSDHISVVPSLNPWPHLQLITYNMVFVALPLGWSYFRGSLFDLQPLNRQTVVENMDDAVFVFDKNDHLRNSNVQARQLFGIDPAGLEEGTPAVAVFGDHPTLLGIYQTYRDNTTPTGATADSAQSLPERVDSTTDSGVESTLVQLSDGNEQRYYDFRVSAIRSSTDDPAGTVVVARDVTVRRRQRDMLKSKKRELERQNERLDQFASMVSHDLRNPLNVAQGRIELIAREADSEHAESARDALGRMERMIDEMLTLARAGRTIEEPAECRLADVVIHAWGNVQAAECELHCSLDTATTEADRNRLVHVFENLFRNAVDHNDPPLTVRVGLLDAADGFYVEDTGGGIPEDERKNVFDHGYTTSEDGNGYGLAIVHEIVEAHGWTITVTEGRENGTRFEIVT